MELSGNTSLYFPFKKIRIIPFKFYSGSLNMAIDYYLNEQMPKFNQPVLRFYGWRPYCLSLGKHQDISSLDIEKLRLDGYDLVRRPTGGSAIFHSGELTYSIVIPKQMMHHKELYLLVHQILHRTLRKLGYSVELQAQNDTFNYLKKGNATFICFNRSAYTEIKYANKKLVGSAQKIYSNAILQHGSILLNNTQNRIVNYFKQNSEQQKRNLEYLSEHSTSLRQIINKNIDAEKLSVGIIEYMKESLEVCIEPLKKHEISSAEKFCSDFTVKNIN